MSVPDDEALDRILAERVSVDGAYKPFAEMTLAEVETRAAELGASSGIGAMERVATVGSVWKGLAEAMTRAGAATVADLDREDLRSRADRLWVIPPGGSFL